MLMVVFGAGASYDSSSSFRPGSGRDSPYRPPLANDLFDAKEQFRQFAQKYPRVLQVIQYLREIPEDKSIEEVLETLQAEAGDYDNRKRQMAAIRYYLYELLWECTTQWDRCTQGDSNYRTLLDQIERHRGDDRVALVTFNYDRLLEHALVADFGFKIDKIAAYMTSHPGYKLFKLHGSIDWARAIANPPQLNFNRHNIIEGFPDLLLSSTFTVCGNNIDSAKGLPLFPALAIPVQTKKSFECPDEHIQTLNSMIAETTKILFIGWRAQETHFLDLLRQNLPSLRSVMVVDKNESNARKVLGQIQNDLRDKVYGADTVPAYGGFSDFVRKREGEAFLKAKP